MTVSNQKSTGFCFFPFYSPDLPVYIPINLLSTCMAIKFFVCLLKAAVSEATKMWSVPSPMTIGEPLHATIISSGLWEQNETNQKHCNKSTRDMGEKWRGTNEQKRIKWNIILEISKNHTIRRTNLEYLQINPTKNNEYSLEFLE